MTKGAKNIAASVHQRLLDKARESSRPFNELLQYFAIERFIYRIAKSSYANRFILKGALMFSAWSGALSRPTMDIDLLGKIDNKLDTITAAIKEACLIEVEKDGIYFDAETVDAIRITEDAEYEGVRVRVHGNMGKARVSIQIDIGFGDVIIPNPETDFLPYPTRLSSTGIERLHHGKHNRRKVPGHGEAWRCEQPNERFLRHLDVIPHIQFQRRDHCRGG